MRLERHELRRFSKRTLAPMTKDNEQHHAQRLQHILDVQSDVLDALNAMTKVHIDKTDECLEILYDLYQDALLFSHRGKHLAPASHPKYHTYYMVFKDLEEIIHRQYSKAQREQAKIKALCCPYCDIHLDYFSSPPPSYNPPVTEKSPKPASPRRASPPYTPTSDTSDDDDIPNPPPRIVSSTHVALLGEEDLDNLNLQHLDIRKILAKTSDQLTTDLTLE
jgi:hypothetical protein